MWIVTTFYAGANNLTYVRNLVHSAIYRVHNNDSYYVIIEYETIGQLTR